VQVKKKKRAGKAMELRGRKGEKKPYQGGWGRSQRRVKVGRRMKTPRRMVGNCGLEGIGWKKRKTTKSESQTYFWFIDRRETFEMGKPASLRNSTF